MGVMINMLSGSGATYTSSAVGATEGKVIKSISLEPRGADEDRYDGSDSIVIEVEDGTKVVFRDHGQSCCESRYVTTDADLPSYVGKKIIEYELRDMPGSGDEDSSDYHDVQAFVIHTDEGNIDFVTHVEHNGYYGGFSIQGVILSSPAEVENEEIH
jgi:hypothetical protein